MINTRQLSYVLMVAHERSFSTAAKKLMISQPSLSQYIQKLEKELGVELFERVNPLRLTYAGEIFMKSAQQMLDTEEQMNRILKDIADESVGKMTIGSGYFNGMVFLPHIINAFYQKYPKVQLEVVERIEPELQMMAENGDIDLVISSQPVDEEVFQVIGTVQEEFLLAVPMRIASKMELEGQEDLSVVDITIFREEPFVMLGTQVYMHKLLDGICKSNGFLPNKVLTCTSLNTVYSMVKTGIGISIIPYSAYKFDYEEHIKYFRIENNDLMRGMNIYYKRNRYLTKAMKEFIRIFQKYSQ